MHFYPRSVGFEKPLCDTCVQESRNRCPIAREIYLERVAIEVQVTVEGLSEQQEGALLDKHELDNRGRAKIAHGRGCEHVG